jgi:HAD superfamily hydrolase (TIGR01509 family)
MYPSAIGFDFDHTLGLDNKLETEAFVQLAQRLAVSSGRTFDAERARIAIAREIERYRNGRCSINDAVALAFDDTLGEGVVDGSATDAFRALAVELAPRYVQPLPGVETLLSTLDDASIPYAILTNGWNPLQQRKADCIGFLRAVFVSDDLGLRKPNVHAFNVLCDHFGLPAESIWYVGDDPVVDVLGALGAGMRAIWFNWEHRTFPTSIPAPTAIVTDIRDILEFKQTLT